MKYVIAMCFVLWSGFAAAAPVCPVTNAAELKKAIADKGADEIVFFASWCLACKDHIQQAGEKTVFVAVFDDEEKAEKAFTAIGGKGPCYFDKSGEIAKQYNVTGLPAKVPAS